MATNISVSNDMLGGVERKSLGAKRSVTQVFDTIQFEIGRNFKKLLIMLVVFTGIFLLFLIIDEVRFARGIKLPEKPVNFISGYLGMMNFLVLISAATFGGSLIAVDFEKLTGNLIFPKISRDRLLAGRFTAAYFMNALCIIYYYVIVGIYTYVKYDEIPEKTWNSLGMALLYTLAVLSFVLFWSSLMKTTASAVVISVMMLLIVFSIVNSILMVSTQQEPYFLLDYLGYSITSVFDMPDPRYMDMEIAISETDKLTMRSWLTPEIDVAIWGMSIYTVVFFVLAYLRFKTRQN
jgi:ABC-type transport system involved in multi-copper enzyme maturation permease subunit